MGQVIGKVAKWALLGLCWGVLARAWMRFISTSPEFTWTGTAIIVAVPTVIGALAGLAMVARRRRWRGAWLARGVGGGSMVLLGVGAGVMLVPTLLFGTLAVARTDWSRWVRVPLAGLALVPVAGVFAELAGVFAGFRILGWDRIVLGSAWYLALVAAMILILRVSFAPAPRPASPSPGAAHVPAAGSG